MRSAAPIALISLMFLMIFTSSAVFESDGADSGGITTDGFKWTFFEAQDAVTITGYIGSDEDITIPSVIDTSGGGGPGMKSVTTIGAHAFISLSDLTSVTIPGSVTTIGDHAFHSCSGLISVTIPGSVTFVGTGAFESCSGLTSVTIPGSVTSIGDYAFYDCSSIILIIFEGEEPSFGTNSFELFALPDLPTDVYRYDVTLSIDSRSDGRVLTYHKIYRISYMDGDDVLRRQYLLPGDAPSFGGTPEKEGYTFAGWSPAIPAAMPGEDMTVTAVWTEASSDSGSDMILYAGIAAAAVALVIAAAFIMRR